MMNEQVRRIMTRNPVIVGPNDRIGNVIKMMIAENLKQVPVVEFGKLIGLLTFYDVFQKFGEAGPVDDLKVADVMITKVVKISPLDKVGTAVELFVGRQFKTLPVVNLRNELKGVVTTFDILRHAMVNSYPQPILFPEVYARPA